MLAPAPAPVEKVMFQPDQVALLVTYTDTNVDARNSRIESVIGKLNSALADTRVRARLATTDLDIIDFPAASEVTSSNGEDVTALSQPYALVFTPVDGTTHNRPALLELVNQLNEHDLLAIGKEQDLSTEVAVLNWLTSAGPQSGIGTGGPGSDPIPYGGNPDDWRANPPGFEGWRPGAFGLQQSENGEDSHAGDGVEVVILDTAWSLSELADAATQWQGKHSLVDRLLVPGGANALTTMPMDPYDRQRLSLVVLEDHPYPMPDHGLFVAGIINTIAPQAKLTLVEVLNRNGIGDLQSIARGLKWVADRQIDQPIVINCSLCLDLPFNEKHNWFDILKDWLGGNISANWLNLQSWALRRVCDTLFSQGRRVIAAAGNESKNIDARPPARYPAAYTSVVGVGALPRLSDADLARVNPPPEPTGFSNAADKPPRTGVVTLGGTAGVDNGVLGIYLGTFPGRYFQCAPGWAWWAGTSFATPIVSGLLAVKLSDLQPAATLASSVASGHNAITDLYNRGVIRNAVTRLAEDLLAVRQNVVP